MLINEETNLDLLPKMIDIINADYVEIVTSHKGEVWINIDGICMLRVKRAGNVKLEMELFHGNKKAEG